MTDEQEFDDRKALRKEKIRALKAYSVLILLALFLIVVVVRLFSIQIVQGAELRESAQRQYESKVEVLAQRGRITDANGQILATTVQRRSYAVDPNMVQNPALIAKYLQNLTGIPASVYKEKIAKTKGSFVWLARSIESDAESPLDTLNDVGLIRLDEPRRHYAYGMLASHILGYSDIDNKGVAGIEMSFDTLLQGKNGFAMLMRDGKGRKRIQPGSAIQPPAHGKDIVMTIDVRIQRIAEDELTRQMLAVGAESGTVVILKPQTGEIAAMASYPAFNPNAPAASEVDARKNRCIADIYEPGSTFKLVTAAALLEEDIIQPQDKVDGKNGVWQYKDVTIRDAHELGKVTFTEAFEQSSNIIFAELAQQLPPNTFYKYIRDFGFGIFHGIELPGELKGSVKKPEDFDGTSQAFMSYGYQLAATPLQMAAAYAAIANNGVLMKPHTVKAVIDQGDTTYYPPQRIRRVVSETTAKTLLQLLKSTVERGTGKAAALPTVAVGGKTGTAQQLADGSYSKKFYTSSFVGLIPALQPEYVIVVMMNKPQTAYYGGTVAAPVFAALAKRLVASGLLTSAVEKLSLSRLSRANSPFAPDVRGLAIPEAEDYADTYSCDVLPDRKQGIIISQVPAPGDSLPPNRVVKVRVFKPQANSTAMPNIPSLKGLSVRRALNIAHALGFQAVVQGNGIIVQQEVVQEGKVRKLLLTCQE